jgi:hypothetical protein
MPVSANICPWPSQRRARPLPSLRRARRNNNQPRIILPQILRINVAPGGQCCCTQKVRIAQISSIRSRMFLRPLKPGVQGKLLGCWRAGLKDEDKDNLGSCEIGNSRVAGRRRGRPVQAPQICHFLGVGNDGPRRHLARNHGNATSEKSKDENPP